MTEQNIDQHSPAEAFEQALGEMRRNAPPVGLAALAGKTPNKALKRAWTVLNAAGIKLERGSMNYRYRAIHNASPKLGHALEEVLVFGDSLFSAMSKKQSPESLRQEFIDLKQRFSKIIKETEVLATPKEEKKLFSFFEKSGTDAEKMELRLDNLDTLLDEAHNRSRALLQKTELDLHMERAFHRAAEWYVLALERAQRQLEDAVKSGMSIDLTVVNDLKNALHISSATTTANLATSDQFLRVKEMLHNKSITFLTAHENTFTVIQGHLRSWKDIKNQTDALNALSSAVQAGSSLMSSASIGTEDAMKNWNPSFISPEALNALSKSFGEYDQQVSDLVTNLTAPKEATGPRFSRWDQWSDVQKNLFEPLISGLAAGGEQGVSTRLRPTLRKKSEILASQAAVESDLAPASADQSVVSEPVLPAVPVERPTPVFSRLDLIVLNQALSAYRNTLSSDFNLEHAAAHGWDANEILERMSAPTRAELVEDWANQSVHFKSYVDYLVQYGDKKMDWSEVVDRYVAPFDMNSPSWKEEFTAWTAGHDDLDWSYLMQWNELVYDLLIFEHDAEQKHAVLSAQTPADAAVRQATMERIAEFVSNPGLTDEAIKKWGFSGLVIRYAMALDMPSDKVEKLWRLWDNPVQPVDWDGSSVRSWLTRFENDVLPPNAQKLWSSVGMDQASAKSIIVDTENNLSFNTDQNHEVAHSLSAANLKERLSERKEKSIDQAASTKPRRACL